MARSRSAALVLDRTGDADRIIAWYREKLEDTFPRTDLPYEPETVGPTWQYDNGWVLPDYTLGWDALAFAGLWLKDGRGDDWQYTMEQARFVLWFYALEPVGTAAEWLSADWVYQNGALQRMKGWGKDPVAATMSFVSAFGTPTFDHWDGDRPVGREELNAWVQILATTTLQTGNTFKLFPGMIPRETRQHFGIQVGKENVWGLGDTRHIQAVPGNVAAVEGGRPTLIIRSETQLWGSGNQGHDMAAAIDGNAAKSPEGAARMLDIFNAFVPGRDSVAERTREAYDATQGDDPSALDFGLLYDSLEAPQGAPLTVEEIPAVVDSIRGDSTWLSIKRIMKSILDPRNSPSESRRKWYNQIWAPEDAWMKLADWDAAKKPRDLVDGERIFIFGDGSKSDDATALVGCAESDGYVFSIGVWQRPPHLKVNGTGADAPPPWIVDRADVDWRVRETAEKFRIIGFWFDPSDARDDETGERFWETFCDSWAELLADTIELPAVKDGDNAHLIIWDMRDPRHQRTFVENAERFTSDLVPPAGLVDFVPRFFHDGSARLRNHVGNARRRPNKYGIGLGKENRESPRKVDAAVCAVGVRMMLRIWSAMPKKKKRSGKVW